MSLVVYDLEWNNVAYMHLETFKEYRKCPNEIVEIGAVKLDDNLNVIDTFETCIRPTIYGLKLDRRLIKDYKFSVKELEKGQYFEKAIDAFRSWLGEGYTLCTWGSDDMIQLKTNCNYYNMETDWITKSIDVQRYYMKTFNLLKHQQISLENALKDQNIPTEDSFHRALNDAIYTACLLKQFCDDDLLSNEYYYERRAYKPKLSVDLSKIELDKSKLRPRCPQCGKFAKTIYTKIGKTKIRKTGYCNKCGIKVKHQTKINVYVDGEIEYITTNEILTEEVAMKTCTS